MNNVFSEKDLRESVYGAVIGDALGVPYEFQERGTFRCTDMVGYGTHDQPAGTWSDDSSMLLATCKSIKDLGRVDTADLRAKFRAWMNEGEFSPFGEVFDIGNTTRQALLTGEPRMDRYHNGNGSLMRILPLAFTDASDDEIRAVSAVTHGHWISTEACVIYVKIIRDCLKAWAEAGPDDRAEKGREIMAGVVHALDLPEPFDRLSRIDTLEEDEIRSSGYVVDTLEAAVWCALTADTFEECLLKAVNLGEDTDTTACVAGGLAAARGFRLEDLPAEWLEGLQNRALIEDCL